MPLNNRPPLVQQRPFFNSPFPGYPPLQQTHRSLPTISPEGLVAGELFPFNSIPASFRQIAAAFQAKTEGSGTMVYFSMLAAWATIMAAQFDVEGLNGREIPISLYTIFESPSGTGKTAVAQEVFRPILKYNRMVLNLMEMHRNEGDKSHANQKYARLVFSDSTIAGLRHALKRAYPVGVFLNSDAALVITKTLFPNDRDFCSIFSGEDVVIARANYEVSIIDPRISMCFMTQMGTVSKKLKNDSEFRSSGLIARSFLIMSRVIVGEKRFLRAPNSQDDEMVELWNQRISDAVVNAFGEGLGYPKERRLVPLSQDAKAYLRELRARIDEMVGQGYFAKWPEESLRIVEKILRVACLHALWERPHDTVVELEDVRGAEAMYFAYFQSLVDLIERPDIDPDLHTDAQDLLRFIDRALQDGAGFSWFDGRQNHWYLKKSIIQQFGPNRLRTKAKLERTLYFLELGRSVAIQKGFAPTGDGKTVKTYLVERLLNSQQFNF
ncbi:MAG: DUF3987 domain-containing protein [Acidithiobacillus ferriphilus]